MINNTGYKIKNVVLTYAYVCEFGFMIDTLNIFFQPVACIPRET